MFSKSKQACLLALFVYLFTPNLNAQALFTDSFDSSLGNWSVSGAWSWDDDGRADGLPMVDWNERSRLQSPSAGGTALFASVESDGQLISPSIQATSPRLFLSFYQYFRSEGGSARVQVLDPGGSVVFTQNLTSSLDPGEETSAGTFQIIELSSVEALNLPSFRIQFDVEGAVDFWLIDDVQIQVNRPDWVSFPSHFAESLADFGIPFTVDSSAMPWVPFELVVDFSETATSADRAALRSELPVKSIKSCVCNRIEVWEMEGGTFFDPETGQPIGDPGDILERVVGSSANTNGANNGSSTGTGSGTTAGNGAVDGIEFNYYNYNELVNNPANPAEPLNLESLPQYPPPPANAVKVAILDTGFDMDHPMLQPFLYTNVRSPEPEPGQADRNCLEEDPLGWNFVHDNNNPVDDHSHGTHVAGIVAQTVRDCDNCNIQLIPYKTHNSYGIGTLYATACATLQASVNDEADIINASWGFYGQQSNILQRAIDTAAAYGTIVVAAAGNDALNLVADAQIPATLDAWNVISVGSSNESGDGLASFSNYSAAFVDVLTLGTDIESSVPDDATDEKTGTSMSTPAVSAAAALTLCQDPQLSRAKLPYIISQQAVDHPTLTQLVDRGNVLGTDNLCVASPTTDRTEELSLEIILLEGGRSGDASLWSNRAGLPVKIQLLTHEKKAISRVRAGITDERGYLDFKLGTSEPGTYTVVIGTNRQKYFRTISIGKH